MRHSQTAVLERGDDVASAFETEPYEAPWAGQARFFVQRLDDSRGEVVLTTQYSPDGLTWCDAENVSPVNLTGELVSWSASEFGAWLRVRGEVSGGTVRLRVYLTCKE